jgi:hypothetical protein
MTYAYDTAAWLEILRAGPRRTRVLFQVPGGRRPRRPSPGTVDLPQWRRAAVELPCEEGQLGLLTRRGATGYRPCIPLRLASPARAENPSVRRGLGV